MLFRSVAFVLNAAHHLETVERASRRRIGKVFVEQYHGGRIFVERSEPGRGTTFRINLPLV